MAALVRGFSLRDDGTAEEKSRRATLTLFLLWVSRCSRPYGDPLVAVVGVNVRCTCASR